MNRAGSLVVYYRIPEREVLDSILSFSRMSYVTNCLHKLLRYIYIQVMPTLKLQSYVSNVLKTIICFLR